MKTPSYWKNDCFVSKVLSPLGCLYTFATRLNIRKSKPKSVNKPVICIGNLTAGGTGKTPVALSIAELLQEQGRTPFFVSRGYGGKLKNIVVDNKSHSAQDVGDEPLLLSEQAPVVVNPDRYQGALTAIKNGAEIIVMDDGYQNPGLKKDLSFLVFDGEFGCGNQQGIPAGPMRETLQDGLKRAQAVIIIGDDKHNLKEQVGSLPVFFGKISPKIPAETNKKIIAFAGIGRPQKLYNSLQEVGFTVSESYDFPDHHQYTVKELKQLIDRAETLGIEIYTTTKDFVKIPAELRQKFNVLKIEIQWDDKNALTNFLKNNL